MTKYTLLLTLFICSLSQASDSSLSLIEIPELNDEIKVDGALNEEAWSKAKIVIIDIETKPAENTPSIVATEALIFSSKDTLYVAFKAHDPRAHEIRAYLQDRDKPFDDDFVGIRIDPFNDETRIYEFFSNPLGVQMDILSSEVNGGGGYGNISWDAIWDADGIITEQGYTVEMAIPLRVINFNSSLDIQKWGIEVIRYYPRNVTHRFSNTPKDRNRNCDACQFAPLEGLPSAEQGKNLSIVPSIVYGASQSRDISLADDPWETETNGELSLDFQWGITPDNKLSVSLNPDYSQIEADAGQLSINNTFALFFPEKRAFFLDNSNYFNSNFSLVHTRNIANPDLGIKFTGRHNEHSYGFFLANDQQNSFLIPGNISSSIAFLDNSSESAVARYLYVPNNKFSVGWITTAKTSDNYHNIVNSIDSSYKPTDQDTFRAQMVFTETEYPDALYQDFCNEESCAETPIDECTYGNCSFTEQVLRSRNKGSFTGHGASFSYSHSTRDWHSFISYREKDKDFRADLGFVNQVDYKKLGFGGGYSWYQDGNNWWQKIELYSDWDITHNDNNELMEKEIQASIRIEGQKQFHARLQIEHRDVIGNRYDASSLAIDNNTPLFQETGLSFNTGIQPVSGLQLGVYARIGDKVDRSNNQPGDIQEISPNISWKINRNGRLQASHTWSRLEVTGGELYTANLSDFRATWQFNVRSFIRLSTIYSDIERNPDLYMFDEVNRKNKFLSSQLLYSYKINPQTLFFLGYSDSGYADDLVEDIQQNGRTVFVKLSYAWLK